MTTASGPWAAIRFPLDPGPPLDPFTLAGSDGILFLTGDLVLVGLGSALTIPLPHGLEVPADVEEAARLVASIACDDRCGYSPAGVVAFGALPFDRSEPASLEVPELTYGADAAGNEWLTVVAADATRLPSGSTGLRDLLVRRVAPEPASTEAHGSAPRITPLSSDQSFEAMVAEALDAIQRSELDKVVLARQVDVTLGETIDRVNLLRRWHHLEPNCTIFALPTAAGQFVGASPELLVHRDGHQVHSRPLAGTTDRVDPAAGPGNPPGGGVLPNELLQSTKDGAEHRWVVKAIDQALRPFCSELDVPPDPDLIHLHNITHLGTSVTGTLARRWDGSIPTALELVAALHPTPAVGGVPRDRALALINELEPQKRGHYAGPVGYLDADGNGRWMVGIRALTIDDRTARLAAGVGIVDGSRSDIERVETNLKFTAVFDALAPNQPFSTTQAPTTQAPAIEAPTTQTPAIEADPSHQSVFPGPPSLHTAHTAHTAHKAVG